jgi:hypothetical protein
LLEAVATSGLNVTVSLATLTFAVLKLFFHRKIF